VARPGAPLRAAPARHAGAAARARRIARRGRSAGLWARGGAACGCPSRAPLFSPCAALDALRARSHPHARRCNGTRESIRKLVGELNGSKPQDNMEVLCAPPMLYLDQVLGSLDKRYGVAAQNAWLSGPGAFTGETAAEQLKDVGLSWVILGHSERRALCLESNAVVGTKTAHALACGLKVILCVGETLAEREKGVTMAIIEAQLSAVAAAVKDWSSIVIAYEPVWAIGTGKVATPEQAQEVHAAIRSWLAAHVSPESALHMRIQYGGSVNAGNAHELARLEDVDGFLVGGASLKGADFVAICNSAETHYKTIRALV
jgi:triosephosphate isomerase